MFKKNLILIEIILIAVCFESRVWADEDVRAGSGGILAFGDIRGHVEPCGCDPRTDVGGVRRIAAAVARYRLQVPHVAVISLGNFVKPKDPSAASDAIIKVINIIKPDASLVNSFEWDRLQKNEPVPDVSLLLSNVRTALAHKNVEVIRRIGPFEIFGYLGRKDKNLMPVAKELINKWQGLTRVKRPSERVLLFSGTDDELRSILRAQFFGTTIRSSRVKLGEEIGDQEQNNERLLLTTFNKTMTWSTPYGGAGLLRVAGLEKKDFPKPVSVLLQETGKPGFGEAVSKNSSSENFGGIKNVKFIHWLRISEEAGAPEAVLEIFKSLRKSDRDSFAKIVEVRSSELDKTDFVGAEACAGCHAASYDVWKRSRHATAIRTLVEKDRHEDVYCVECHVLGFKSKGGYVSEKLTPHFSNVQCENCHGPRRQHVQMPTKKSGSTGVIDPKNSCAECHTPPHSPGFNQKSYWKAIEHK